LTSFRRTCTSSTIHRGSCAPALTCRAAWPLAIGPRRTNRRSATAGHRQSILRPPDHLKSTLGKPRPLLGPFPAKPNLPLAGFWRFPSLAAARDYMARSEVFLGLERKTKGPVCKKPVFKIVEKSGKCKSNFVGFLVKKPTFYRKHV
jgi:hypothetical protein